MKYAAYWENIKHELLQMCNWRFQGGSLNTSQKTGTILCTLSTLRDY
jgi:hypothetical protein